MFAAGRPVCIVNPASAGGETGRRWPRLRFELERTVGPVDTLLTGSPGEATELARVAAEKGANLVVAVGGDGTVGEVVNGLMSAETRPPDLALGVVPAGTGTDLARTLGIPANGDEALKVLATGRRARLDVGRVEFLTPGAPQQVRYFANIASFGVEAHVDQRIRTASRRLGGRAAYAFSAVGALLAYRPQKVILRVGDAVLRRTILAGVVANGRFFGGGMEVAPSAQLDDGRFELVLIRQSPLWRLVIEGRRLYNRSIYHSDLVEHLSVVNLEAESDSAEPVLLGIDGEPIGQLPARFSVMPAALHVIVGTT